MTVNLLCTSKLTVFFIRMLLVATYYGYSKFIGKRTDFRELLNPTCVWCLDKYGVYFLWIYFIAS